MGDRHAAAGRYVRQRRRNLQSGTTVEVLDSRHPDSEFEPEPANPWLTLCVTHGTLASHPTLQLARAHATGPTLWCSLCHDDAVSTEATPDR